MTISRTLNQTFLFAASFLSVVPVYAAFSDVPLNHPNAEAIAYVQAQGIVSGYPDGTFKPDQQINRAEFTKIVEESIPDAEDGVELCPPDLHDAELFSDVSADDWFALYVCMAKGRGVIKGYPDGRFRPAQSVNFVEAAKIIYQANHLDSRGIVIPAKEGSSFPWYFTYVRYLEDGKAIPKSISMFDQKITRGEMAEIIYKMRQRTTRDGGIETSCDINPVLACVRDAQRRADVNSIAGAITDYYRIKGKLPIDIPESGLAICTMSAIEEGICTGPVADLSLLVGEGLLKGIPIDPSFAPGTKHTGYELFKYHDFMGVSALQGEITKGISVLILLPTIQ